MQPNTSLRLRMCISPLMFRPNIIPFFLAQTHSTGKHSFIYTFLHPNCQNRSDLFSHPSPCTSFIAICVSQSKTTTRNKQPRILPPPFSNPPTPRNNHRQKDKGGLKGQQLLIQFIDIVIGTDALARTVASAWDLDLHRHAGEELRALRLQPVNEPFNSHHHFTCAVRHIGPALLVTTIKPLVR